MNAILHNDMTRAEAETINRSIKDCITETRAMLLEMRDRKGWKVLGFASFEEYGKAELGYEQAYLYRLAQAAEVAARISTIVENPSTIPVTQLIPLSRVEPELQIEVFQAAQARAETENSGKVTAKIVETMVQEQISRTKPKPRQQATETQDESVKPTNKAIQEKIERQPQPGFMAMRIWGILKDFEREGLCDLDFERVFSEMTDDMKADTKRLSPAVLKFFKDLNGIALIEKGESPGAPDEDTWFSMKHALSVGYDVVNRLAAHGPRSLEYMQRLVDYAQGEMNKITEGTNNVKRPGK